MKRNCRDLNIKYGAETQIFNMIEVRNCRGNLVTEREDGEHQAVVEVVVVEGWRLERRRRRRRRRGSRQSRNSSRCGGGGRGR